MALFRLPDVLSVRRNVVDVRSATALASVALAVEDDHEGYRGSHRRTRTPKIGNARQYTRLSIASSYLPVETGPASRTNILQMREARELSENDGSCTYVVHSTTVKVAETISEQGLKFITFVRHTAGGGMSPGPDLSRTGFLLAGPGDEQLAANVEALTYEFVTGRKEPKALVVLGFPEPNPGTYAHPSPFEGTFLQDASQYIQPSVPGQDVSPDHTYTIPTEYVAGYINQESGEFVHNPQYWGAASRNPALPIEQPIKYFP